MFLAKQEVNWKEENFLYIDQVVLSEIEHRNDKIRKYDVVNDTSVVSGGIPKNIVRTYNIYIYIYISLSLLISQ